MSLFENQHATQDEKQAKELMRMVVVKNVSKYIMIQTDLAVMLATKKPVLKCKNKKKCSLCNMDAMISLMSECQATTREACKIYKAMFDEDLDLHAITIECKEAIFKSKRKDKKSNATMENSQGFIIPEDAPQEVKDICASIKSALEKDGFDGAHMEVIDVSAYNYGLKQEDFESFGDFAQAVSEARLANSGKSPEEMLTNTMMNKAQEEIKKSDKKTKLN